MNKNFVVDTNVLIDDPKSLVVLRNDVNEVSIPLEVILELDKLKTDSKVGSQAREAIRFIYSNRDWINLISDFASEDMLSESFDGKILANIVTNYKNGILVSNDMIMRFLAEKLYGYPCEEYKESVPYLSDSESYSGFSDGDIVNSFTWVDGKPVFNGVSGQKCITYENNVWGIAPKNVYQNLALDLLLNPDIDVVTLQSSAGKGKSLLSLAAAFHLVLQEKRYKKIFITKSTYEVDKELGFLPGNIDEKFLPAVRSVIDLIYKLHDIRPAHRLFKKDSADFDTNKIELLPLNFTQGMNIEDSVLIVEEGQNLSRSTMRTIATRCGENTKLIVIGDTRQVINPYVNEFNNGLNWLVKLCKGKPNYGHIVLKGKTSRGPVTDLILECGL